MRTKLRLLSPAILLCLLAISAGKGPAKGQQRSSSPKTLTPAGSLAAGFAHPPAQARLRCYWWWLNGHTDKATITHDLEQMRLKGFGGALLVDANGANQGGNRNVPAGPTFGSPEWVELYRHALREADRLDLEITLNITSGWNLGGPGVKPEAASKLLTWTTTQVQGGHEVSLVLPQPPLKNGFYREIAVLAYPARRGALSKGRSAQAALKMRSAAVEAGFSMPNADWMLDAGPRASDTAAADASLAEVVDLSGQTSSDGNMRWSAPAGDWEVLRIGYTDSDARVSTASGAWQGLAIDYLNREAFNEYWESTVEPLLDAAKPYRSLKYLATDSWELGGTNWTQTFREEFKGRRGYDPVPWLPVVAGRVIGTPDSSTRFLADLRRTVADLVVANHYDVFAQRAAQHGLGVQAESGGPHGAPIDALETFRGAAIPQSEFWSINPHRSKDEERFFTKEAASAANIYGQHIVAQEGETSIGPQWSESLAADLKPSFDRAITEGMNRLVWHEFTSSPADTGLPGQEYFAGTHLNPKVTWWSAGDAFFAYLNRVQFMMQQGTPVDDLLYFTGDNVPSFVRLKADDPAGVLPGYDFDATDEDALLHRVRIQGSTIVGPSGVVWRALALPASGRISLASLPFVERYVAGGGAVIGPRPKSPAGLASPGEVAEFSRTADAMWGSQCADESRRSYGKGVVFCTTHARSALRQLGVLPDVEATEAGKRVMVGRSAAALDYVHRRGAFGDVYFLRNGTAEARDLQVTFRASAAVPEVWNPVTGERTAATTLARTADGRTAIAVKLPAFGSAFVVFPRGGSSGVDAPFHQLRSEPLKVKRAWTSSFQPGRGAPADPVRMDQLRSWTESDVAGIRFFSGTATYTAFVDAPQAGRGERVLLKFADVREIARVKVNGHDAGTVWARPLTVRVDPWLKPGENRLDIEVTNLWPNRIIGDLQPGATVKITQTNITAYTADSPLLPSGIMGRMEWEIDVR